MTRRIRRVLHIHHARAVERRRYRAEYAARVAAIRGRTP